MAHLEGKGRLASCSKTGLRLLLLGAPSKGLCLLAGPWRLFHCHPRGLLGERLQPTGEW